MNREKLMTKLTNADNDTNFCIARGKRVLLIGVILGKPILRDGVTEESWDKFGTHYDDNIVGFRFFDSSENRLYDVPRDFMRAFKNHNHIVNASIRCARPFVVSMMDGGRFEDLPCLAEGSLNVTKNDVFIVDRSIPKHPILVNGIGQWAQIKDKKLIELRSQGTVPFYNM